MNTIGTTPIVQQAAIPQAAPAVPVVSATPVAGPPVPIPAQQPVLTDAQIDKIFNAKSVEQRRYAAVQQAAKDIANVYVLGDRRFTIFKDMTGQYITRFTNFRTGEVKYVPEPELLKRTQSAGPKVNIDA